MEAAISQPWIQSFKDSELQRRCCRDTHLTACAVGGKEGGPGGSQLDQFCDSPKTASDCSREGLVEQAWGLS